MSQGPEGCMQSQCLAHSKYLTGVRLKAEMSVCEVAPLRVRMVAGTLAALGPHIFGRGLGFRVCRGLTSSCTRVGAPNPHDVGGSPVPMPLPGFLAHQMVLRP